MVNGATGSFRNTDIFNHVLDMFGRFCGNFRNAERNEEVQDHTNNTDAFRRNAEQPVCRNVFDQYRDKDALVGHDIAHGEDQTDQHACNRAFAVNLLGEDPHDDNREQ